MEMELFFFQMAMAGLALVVVVFAAIIRRTNNHNARLLPVVPVVLVRDRAIARSMLVDHADAFSDRPVAPFHVQFVREELINLSHSITTAPHGPLWRAFRRNLTAGVFHPSRFGLLAGLQREAVDGFIAALSAGCGRDGGGGGGVVVVRRSLQTALLTLLMRMCFGDGGFDVQDVCRVQGALNDFFDGMVGVQVLATSRMARLLHWRRWRRFLGVRCQLEKILLPLIAERCRQRTQSCSDGASGSGASIRPYVDSLLDLEVPDFDEPSIRRALTDDEMVTLVWEFLGAGTGTMVSCIEWVLAHLMIQPEVQEKLYREVVSSGSGQRGVAVDTPYLRAVILEGLRLHPPVAVIQRDIMVGGGAADSAAVAVAGVHPVPPKENSGGGGRLVRLTILTNAIGRDSRVWTEPDEFCPERFLAGGEGEHVGHLPGPKDIRMMPFGAGTRYCPGMGIGMVLVRLLLVALVQSFQWKVPATGGAGAHVDLTEVDGFVKHLKTPLMAHIVPRT